MPPKVSIITVCYNAESTLEVTIKSIDQQKFSDYEHIIVDGASKDKTLSIIQEHSLPKRKWISEPDKGLYDAMNKGIRMANGTYIFFLNAGDYFSDENVLAQLFDTKAEPDVIYGEVEVVDSEGKMIGYRNHRAPKNLHWKDLRFGMVVSHQAFFVKRSLSPMYNISFKLCADIDWMITCLQRSKSVVNSNIIISKFLEGGISSQKRKKAWLERYHVLRKHFGFLPNVVNHFWIVTRYMVRAPFGKNKVN